MVVSCIGTKQLQNCKGWTQVRSHGAPHIPEGRRLGAAHETWCRPAAEPRRLSYHPGVGTDHPGLDNPYGTPRVRYLDEPA